MKLTVLYGETVKSYCVISDDNDDTKIVEMAPSSHQICFSNEFAPGWKKVGEDGTWYMRCCWVNGLENLTREQLQDILKNVSKALGPFVYGTTVNNTVKSVEKKLESLVYYIVSNSTILLEDVGWKWNDIKKFEERVQTMLDGEAENMRTD